MWFLPISSLISQESVYLLFICVNCNAKCTHLWSEWVIQNHVVTFYKQDRKRRQNCLKLPGVEISQGLKPSCPYPPRKLQGICPHQKPAGPLFYFAGKRWRAVLWCSSIAQSAFKNMTQSLDAKWLKTWPWSLLKLLSSFVPWKVSGFVIC